MATDISVEEKPVAPKEGVPEGQANGYFAGLLEKAKQNVKVKYLDLLNLLASITKEWITPDDKASKYPTIS